MTADSNENVFKEKQELLKLLKEKEDDLKYNQFNYWFSSEGKYRRELYPKHIEALNASAKHSQIAIIGANRSGKTFTTKYTSTMHATGKYPEWYEGRKFYTPVNIWVVGKSSQSVREVLQEGLLGKLLDLGSGMIPKEDIVKIYRRSGTSDTIETVLIRHVSGGLSSITFKSYEQGWEAFHGTYMHLIVLDEEPRDPRIYTECITRTANDIAPGIVMMSFTPLFGASKIALSFCPFGKLPENGVSPNNKDKFAVQVSWDDSLPHLTENEKERLKLEYSEYEIDARTKGDIGMSVGKIYTMPEADIKVNPFIIPKHWLKVYGLDFGKNVTACIWGALDPENDVLYLYGEYYGLKQPLAVNGSAIRQRSKNISGVIDPAAIQGNIVDGVAIIDLYRKEGLDIQLAARNLVESGIAEMQNRFETGRLKVFSTLTCFFNEYNVYSKDENGKIRKENDHLMDATRYLVMSGLYIARPSEDFLAELKVSNAVTFNSGRNRITGY